MRFDLIECGYPYDTREFPSIEEAAEEAESSVDRANYDADDDRTMWVDWEARLAEAPDCETNCPDNGTCGACHPGSRSGTVTIEPIEPGCTEDAHDYEDGQPFGHGGGVVYTDICRHCGLKRRTDTWAQRSDTGEQGLVEVSYTAKEEAA